jgi:hypothetical protein
MTEVTGAGSRDSRGGHDSIDRLFQLVRTAVGDRPEDDRNLARLAGLLASPEEPWPPENLGGRDPAGAKTRQ